MTLFELSVPKIAGAFANVQPFVYALYPGIWATGDYWTTAFGAPAESDSEIMYITSFSRDGINRYSGVTSLADCIATEQTFFWDNAAQRLYVHLEHDQYPDGPVYQYGKVMGFTKDRAVYIDDIFYSPVLESIPSLAQQQDLENYDVLAFLSGSVKLHNHLGELDWALDTPAIGYDCTIGNLAESSAITDGGVAITDGGVALTSRPATRGCDSYSRSEIQSLVALYVEKQSARLDSLTLSLQDRRKKQNIKIPTEVFTVAAYPDIDDSIIDKPIPLLYGTVRCAPAICTNGKLETGAVAYRVADSLTVLGTVEVKIADVWTVKTPATTTLSTGSFTLSASDGRNSSGNSYECRVNAPTGVAVTYASDIIKALNLRYLGIQYTDSEYDKTEWEASEALLSSVGILIDKQVELFEVIRQIQAGANIGFRYEYNSHGQRTIRIDDWTAASTFRIAVEDIINIADMEISTDPALLAATIKLNYAKDYTGDTDDQTIIDTSQAEYVRQNHAQEPQLEFDSLLQTPALAAAAALVKAGKYGVARKIATLSVTGYEFLALRIYDVGIVELTPSGYDMDSSTIIGTRKWAGVWKAIVLDIDPDPAMETNALRLALIEDVTDVYPIIIKHDGVEYYLTDESDVAILTR